MKFTVDTSDLRAISTVFTHASTEVDRLQVELASRASGPESQSAIGTAAAAERYTTTLRSWMRSLDVLAASLKTLALKVDASAQHYEDTESGNTIRADQSGARPS